MIVSKESLVVLVLFCSALLTAAPAVVCRASSRSNDSQEVHVKVAIELLERTSEQLKFRVLITNDGKDSVLIVTDPVRKDGSKGPYISLADDDPSLLKVAFQVFPPPDYTILAPKNRVTFKSLAPGATYQAEILLAAPLFETKPPWGETWHTQSVDIAKIREVSVGIGVLPDQPVIREALDRVVAPTGFEMVKRGELKGKPLFDIQVIVSKSLKL